MADSTTPFLTLVQPENFASEDTWGTKLNGDFDLLDAAVQALVEQRNYGLAGGTVDVITLAIDPPPLTLTDGLEARFRAAGANTVSPTLNLGGLGAKAIKYADGASPAAGALAAGVIYEATFSATGDCWVIGATSAASATAAETLAGTDIAKVLTAAGFAGNKALTANGYYRFPGGFTVQWGATSTAITSESDHAVIFPVAFANACGAAVAMANNPAGSSGNDGFPQLKAMSTTGATFRMQDVGGALAGVTWIAVGY